MRWFVDARQSHCRGRRHAITVFVLPNYHKNRKTRVEAIFAQIQTNKKYDKSKVLFIKDYIIVILACNMIRFWLLCK